MIRAATRRIAHGIAYLIFGVAALSVIGLWRIASGPVELGFLRPLTQQTIETPEGPIRLSAGQVLLVWSGWQAPVQISLADVRAVDVAGHDVAVIPQASGNISLRSLLSGRIGLTEIVVPRVRFHAAVSGDGILSLMAPPVAGDADASSRAIGLFIEQLLADLNDRHPLGRLSRVTVEHASATIYDRATGFIWNAPDASATLSRDAAGVRIRGALRIETSGSATQARIDALYRKSDRRIEAQAKVEDFRPSAFAAASPELAPLASLDLPMSGEVVLAVAGSGAIDRLEIDVRGGAGQLAMAGVLAKPLQVRDALLRAKVDPAKRRLTVAPLKLVLDGPTLEVVAEFQAPATSSDARYSAEINASLMDLPTSRLAEFWPELAASGGRRWVLDNIAEGRLEKASGVVRLEGVLRSGAGPAVRRASGDLTYRDLSVRYLDGMAAVRGVNGSGRYEAGRLRLGVDSGEADGIRVVSGRIDILGLDAEEQRAEIEVSLAGSAPAALALLAQPRLGLPKDLLFDPKRAQGEVKADVTFRFPLIAALSLAQLEYGTRATIYGGTLQQVVAGLTLSDATATLDLTGAELSVAGKGKLDGQELDFAWRELFGDKPAFRRRYQATALSAVPVPWALKVIGTPEWATYVGGTLGGDIAWQTPLSGPSELTARLNLRGATLKMAPLGWEKAAGVDGRAAVTARFSAGAASPNLVSVDGQAGDLSVRGSVDVSGGQFRSASLARLSLGRSDVSLGVQRTTEGFAFDIRGKALDVAPLLVNAQAPGAPAGRAPAAPPRLDIAIDVANLLLKRGALGAVGGSARLRGSKLEQIALSLAAGATTISVQPHADGRSLRIEAGDLGALLRAAGWMDGIAGGKLSVSGQYADAEPGSPLKARVVVQSFRLNKVQTSPNGIPDLNGLVDGLSSMAGAEPTFKVLEGQLRQTEDLLEIKGGRAHGTSVGMTAEGKIDLRRETVAIDGTVVPGYVVNNLLSNIPLIGDILVGGKGGGLVAIGYSVAGPLDNPKVSINPLSALAIGPLRLIFRGATPEDANDAEKALGGPDRLDSQR